MYVWLEAHLVTVTLATFCIGCLLAFVANYLLIYLKLSSEMAFIKGQLSEVLKFSVHIDDLADRHAKLETELSVTGERVNYIERHFLNGGYHGAGT